MQLLQETAARRGQDWSLELSLVTRWMLSPQYYNLSLSLSPPRGNLVLDLPEEAR